MGASAPKQVSDLGERFDRDRKVFLSPDYKEEQLCAEFLNPFITALDWGMGIVENTVGRLLGGGTPAHLTSPSC